MRLTRKVRVSMLTRTIASVTRSMRPLTLRTRMRPWEAPMNVGDKHYRTIWLDPDDESVVQIIDQR